MSIVWSCFVLFCSLQLQRAATRVKPLSNKDRGKTLIDRNQLNTNPLTGPLVSIFCTATFVPSIARTRPDHSS
ncbi:hypothetical protein J3E68DRAFT_408261 [Trichoderma sp. SZMC 28012]